MAIVINGSGTVTGISVGGLPDDIVDAGTLADNAVGLAQMAGGTDGNIITYDTSGNPAVVATGSDGQILTSAGADAVPAFEAAADNTPSFSASRTSGEQSIPNTTWTKVEFPNELWDTDSAFDTTNDKFVVPSGEGGKYLFNYAARGESLDAGEQAMLRLYKNGSALDSTRTNGYAAIDNQQVYIRGSAMLALDAADYIELWAYQSEGASRNLHNEYLHFSGIKLIGV